MNKDLLSLTLNIWSIWQISRNNKGNEEKNSENFYKNKS
jgi:hypothetical protein